MKRILMIEMIISIDEIDDKCIKYNLDTENE